MYQAVLGSQVQALSPFSRPAAGPTTLNPVAAARMDCRLIKELWAYDRNRIAVRFAYECHDDSGQWFRSYGNENWEFNDLGFMTRRFASINDLPIQESQRKFFWPLGRRPDVHPGLSDLNL